MVEMNRIYLLKIIELVLTCVLFGLHYHSFQSTGLIDDLITSTTFGGYIIILTGEFAGILGSQPLSKDVDTFYSMCGVALFAVSGFFTINHFGTWGAFMDTTSSNIGFSKGFISLINAIVFLLDLIFTLRA